MGNPGGQRLGKGGDGDEVNWGDVFWELQELGDPRFSHERFWRAPITLVVSGLRACQYRRIRNSEILSRAIAMIAAPSYRGTVEDLDVAATMKKAINQKWTKEAESIYLSLVAERKVPSWVLELMASEGLSGRSR